MKENNLIELTARLDFVNIIKPTFFINAIVYIPAKDMKDW